MPITTLRIDMLTNPFYKIKSSDFCYFIQNHPISK
jgi:hypothetical protein